MHASTLIPVHVLTGALGSGKTTLLNSLLQAGLGADTAVIVNEFGDVALDQLFIAAHSAETVVLKSGCVCCTMRTDLKSTLLDLLARRGNAAPLRRVLIETSGISDPLPILQTLRADSNVATRFRIGSVICAVSALEGSTLASRPEALRQITAADAIVLTKDDIADVASLRAVKANASRLNPFARQVDRRGPELLRSIHEGEARTDARDLAWMQARAPVTHADHDVRSTVIRGVAPRSWSQFTVWLTRLVFVHGERILRTKGVLFDASRDVWIGVHGVRRFFHPPVHLDLARPPEFGASLVFITEHLDPARIEASYAKLVAPGEECHEGAFRAQPAPLHSTAHSREHL